MDKTKDEFLSVIHYDNCITNLANSILHYYHVDTEGKMTLPAADEYLEKDYKNVVILLLDALGVDNIKKNTSPDGFFQRHLSHEFYSVYPPTTVAATTSLLSGKNPCETGWLGWECYIPQLDQNVEMFTGKKAGTEEPAADFHPAWKFFGYENILSKINRNGGSAYLVAPFMDPFPKTEDEIFSAISKLCEKPGKKFIYAYWNQPDGTFHRKGCFGPEAKEEVRKLEEKTKTLCEGLENTLVFITADHGHIDVKNKLLTNYPKITECFVRTPSLEPRVLNFFVKKEKEEQFVFEFQKEFGQEFLLLTKAEVLENHIFGFGKEQEYFRKMLGDFVAFATGETALFPYETPQYFFKGFHAGLKEEEMKIPLIVFEAR